jgi:conjugative transfer signal peptidase TraF
MTAMTDALRRFGEALRDRRARNRKRLRIAAATGALIVALGVSIAIGPSPRLVWNASASAPIGLWWVAPDAQVKRGNMVIARLAEPWRAFAARRHYLPANVPLIKRVAAEPGDRICAVGTAITVNGVTLANRRETDGAGRAMPRWQGCQTLRDGAVLLLMSDPDSFDGRYVGPTARGEIIGRAWPLWLR